MTPERSSRTGTTGRRKNPDLPVLHYRRVDWAGVGALPSGREAEAVLRRNDGQAAAGRNGILSLSPLSPTVHEVLAVVAGRGACGSGVDQAFRRLRSRPVTSWFFRPAPGPCLVEAGRRIQVIGAYPAGQEMGIFDASAPDEAMPCESAE